MDFEKNGTMHNLNFLTEVEVWSRVLTSLFKRMMQKLNTMCDTATESLDVVLCHMIILGYHHGTQGTPKPKYVRHLKLGWFETILNYLKLDNKC